MRSLLGRFHRPMSRGLVNNMLTMNNLGDGSTLSLDFTTMGGVLDPRLTFTRSTTATYINSSGYVTSAAINDPRFDYNPTNIGEPKGLLIEGAATNPILYSQDFSQATWSKSNATATGPTTAPDGTTTAYLLTSTTAGGVISQTHAPTGNATSTYSIYVKEGSAAYCDLYIYDNVALSTRLNVRFTFVTKVFTVTAGSNAVYQQLTNGWFRISVTCTALSLTNNIISYLYVGFAVAGTTYYGWGAQLEAGSGASSYIPTGASTVTRSAELLAVTSTTTMGLNTSEGTFFVETELPRGGLTTPAQFGAPYTNGSWLGQFYGAADATTLIANWWGGSGLGLSRSGNPKSLTALSYGLYTGTSIPVSSSLNGAVSTGTFTTLSSNNAPNPTTWNFIALACNSTNLTGSGRDHLNSCIKKFKYFPTRLTNEQLQTLTTP